jgi:hypothetical protein
MNRPLYTEWTTLSRTEARPPTERPHLLENELAQRWRLSARTLQRWRRAGSGPAFLLLGRRVAYRLSDVEGFEAAHLRTRHQA